MQYIALRQFNAGQRIAVDGLIVRTSWDWLAASAPKAPLLLSPANNTIVNLDGPASTPVNISWTAARNMSDTAYYEWQVDTRARATFKPAALVSSLIRDTVLSMTYGILETSLDALGVQPGDTLKAVWRVRATAGTDTLYSNVYNIDLIRKGNSTATETIREVKEFSVYPNPSNGSVVLRTGLQERGMMQIQITDALGRIVLSQTSQANVAAHVSLSAMPDGVYFIQVQTNDARFRPQRLMLRK
jgi:hypothetical protein